MGSNIQRKDEDLSELLERIDESKRYVDLCLRFRRRKTGSLLLEVGGRWDRLHRTYTDDAPERCHTVYVNENQVAIVEQFANWLEKFIADLPRESMLLTGGNRRGGKSYITVACIVAVAIAKPGAICWMVAPTIAKREELERYAKEQTLQDWRRYHVRDCRFTISNGSTIQSITGDTYDALKRGKATAILLNEPQDVTVDVATHGLPAIIDEGGLVLFAGNPPRRAKGEWFRVLRQKVVDGEYVGDASFFEVPADQNEEIDQRARGVIGRVLRDLDPRAAKADDEGLWIPVGDVAYEMWRAKKRVIEGVTYPGLVGILPDLGYTDITVQALRDAGVYRSSQRAPYEYAIGADFQGRPHMAALACKVFKGPDGKRLYYFLREFIAKGNEHDLSDEIQEAGLNPDNAVIVGDASGDWQASKDRRRQLPSWDALKFDRWTVIPPREKIRPESKHASNPPVDISIGQMYVVMRESRVLVHPDCKWLIESLEKCPVKREGARLIIPSKGGYSHITDCARYLVHRFEPKPKKTSSGTPRGGTFPALKPGAGFYRV